MSRMPKKKKKKQSEKGQSYNFSDVVSLEFTEEGLEKPDNPNDVIYASFGQNKESLHMLTTNTAVTKEQGFEKDIFLDALKERNFTKGSDLIMTMLSLHRFSDEPSLILDIEAQERYNKPIPANDFYNLTPPYDCISVSFSPCSVMYGPATPWFSILVFKNTGEFMKTERIPRNSMVYMFCTDFRKHKDFPGAGTMPFFFRPSIPWQEHLYKALIMEQFPQELWPYFINPVGIMALNKLTRIAHHAIADLSVNDTAFEKETVQMDRGIKTLIRPCKHA